MQPSLLDQIDVTENRHRGSPESIAAHEKIVNIKREQHERILRAIREHGNLTLHEVVKVTDLKIQTASARLSELKKRGRLMKTGERRNGAAVLELV